MSSRLQEQRFAMSSRRLGMVRRTPLVTRIAIGVLFGALGLLGTASGQAPPPVHCETNPACLSLFEQAQQQSKAGLLTDALRTYKLAYEVQADPRLLFSIARVLHKQGQAAEAISFYRRYIDSEDDGAAQKEKARDYITQLELVPPPPPPPQEKLTVIPVVAPPESKPVQPESVPVYKKGWFWAVLGGSAAAIGLGIGLGVGLSNRSPSLPDGINTYAATF